MFHKLLPRSVCLIFAAILVLTLPGWKPAAVSHPFAPESSTSLPQQARAPISALIGADQVAYHARQSDNGFTVGNPAHNLSAEFTTSGVSYTTGAYTWGLSPYGYGYGEALQPVPLVAPAANGNRIEYSRGPLSEWYLNGPFGFEQGFTLASPPISKTAGPLTLAMSTQGDLQAVVQADGLGLSLSSPDETNILSYSGLSVYDSEGTQLPAWLELSTRIDRHRPLDEPHLLIRVDDTAARYPLTIDPFVQKAMLTASDKAIYNNFGNSVAISGDVVVVGAPYPDPGGTSAAGAAYVFVKPGGGWAAMTQTARLTASDNAPDLFGYSVSISGDVVVVGAPNADLVGTLSAGAAYVFIKPGGGWADMTQTAKLTASDQASFDNFGFSVSISGGVVVVGAYYANPGGTNDAGAAYVFVKPGGGWADMTQTAKLTASDKAAGDEFGFSVSISGDVVVVGAIYADPGGTSVAGTAYVFIKPGVGWTDMTQTARLTASDKVAGDFLGWSVSISGDVVVVGVPYADPGGTNAAGAAYVFVKPGGGWTDMTQTAKLTASDKAADDFFGWSVSISGDVVVVGALYASPGGTPSAGAAYVFIKPGGGWGNMTQTAKLTASDKAAGDSFGNSVAVSGNTAVIGALYADPESISNAGAAYVFARDNVTINKYSAGAYDGWVLESAESSGKGGITNATAAIFYLGDDQTDKQYRAILSFNTASLPDTAVITSAMIKLKKQGLVGTDPFTTHQGLLVDIRMPYFGTALTLVSSDFQASASKGSVGTFGTTPSAGWYTVTLSSLARPYVNKTGTTQFRLRFRLDDDNDNVADYLMFYSGNAGTASRPVLIIQYYVP